MMGDTTDGQPWKQRAVTFLENHDTGYRTNPDGTPEKDHKFDSFENTWEVEQAYAYILPILACRASTGSTTSTGASDLQTRSARWSTRGRWLAFTPAANSPFRTTRGHAASTLRE